ncbi:MAG: ice-binding family protein [Candidatus Dormibacteraeota bacterium]|nr:ice-binding family protein [Candidatus Dormibacteraeota bacterium]
MKLTRRYIISLAFSALIIGANSVAALAATDPFSGGSNTAGNFAVLAGTTVTNTGPSWITGQLGVSAGSAVTGFPPGTSGVQHKADAVAGIAQTDLAAAYTNAAAQPCPPANNKTGVNLGGQTLVPGVYCQTTAPTLTGTLTLNGSGIYIFQILPATTLVTASGAKVVLIGGAQPCQVFWVVGSSATIATTTQFVGNILALQSIAMQTRATLNGRALARNGAVTLDTNRIIQAAGCGYSAPTYVAPPAGNTLPATLPPSSPILGVPAAGGGPPQGEGFPWVLALVAGILASVGAVRLGVTMRGQRRRTQ